MAEDATLTAPLIHFLRFDLWLAACGASERVSPPAAGRFWRYCQFTIFHSVTIFAGKLNSCSKAAWLYTDNIWANCNSRPFLWISNTWNVIYIRRGIHIYVLMILIQYRTQSVDPRTSILLLEAHGPAEFNPNQTHAKQLIELFRTAWKSQTEAGWI